MLLAYLIALKVKFLQYDVPGREKEKHVIFLCEQIFKLSDNQVLLLQLKGSKYFEKMNLQYIIIIIFANLGFSISG